MRLRTFSAAIVLILIGCGKEAAKPLTLLPALNKAGLNQEEMLRRVNAARASGYRCGEEDFPAVAPLKWNDRLEKSAAAHAQDMAEKHYFSHVSQDGSQVSDRVNRMGYHWSAVGENIAKGQSSIEEVVEGWLHSPGHCKNILNATFTELGASRFQATWVQNFGKPR